MNDFKEKRTYTRHPYSVPVEISYISKGNKFDAQSLNHSEGGMCLASSFSFHPGETLNVRVKEFHPQGPCTGLCEGLRSITLAEVQWCSDVSDTGSLSLSRWHQIFCPGLLTLLYLAQPTGFLAYLQ